jgi:hypothetical protein
MRAQLGRVGIVPARFTPKLLKLDTPAKGLLRGAGRGAAAGAVGGTLLLGEAMEEATGDSGGTGAGGAALLYSAVVLAPVGAVAGGVYGAATAESAATVEQAESTIKSAMSTLELQNQTTMAEHVLHEGIGEERYSFTLVPKLGREHREDEIDFSSLGAEGINTVLEINVIKVGLWQSWDFVGYSTSPFRFSMRVETYLTRTVDRTVLWEHLWSCGGGGSSQIH